MFDMVVEVLFDNIASKTFVLKSPKFFFGGCFASICQSFFAKCLFWPIRQSFH